MCQETFQKHQLISKQLFQIMIMVITHVYQGNFVPDFDTSYIFFITHITIYFKICENIFLSGNFFHKIFQSYQCTHMDKHLFVLRALNFLNQILS